MLVTLDFFLQSTKQVCANIRACHAEDFVGEPQMINTINAAGAELEAQQNLPETAGLKVGSIHASRLIHLQ